MVCGNDIDEWLCTWKYIHKLENLGAQQGNLGAQKGNLGAQQGNLSAQQGNLGTQQGNLGTQQGNCKCYHNYKSGIVK